MSAKLECASSRWDSGDHLSHKTRYCVKWRHGADGAGKLKITDNTTCLKFKTHSSVFLNRFDALNLSLMQKMQNRRPTQASTAPSIPPAPQQKVAQAQDAAAQPPVPSSSGPATGDVNKKKPKKKK